MFFENTKCIDHVTCLNFAWPLEYCVKVFVCRVYSFCTLSGIVSPRSEQTFNRAWNQCPSLWWTQWLKIIGSIYAAAMVMWRYYHVRYYGSHSVNLKLAHDSMPCWSWRYCPFKNKINVSALLTIYNFSADISKYQIWWFLVKDQCTCCDRRSLTFVLSCTACDIIGHTAFKDWNLG